MLHVKTKSSILHRSFIGYMIAGTLSVHAALPIDTVFNDTLWHWVFSDSTDAHKPTRSTDLGAWLPQFTGGNFSVRYPNTDSVEITTDGTTPKGAANAFLTYPYKLVNFSAEVQLRMPATSGTNSGLQWRSWCFTNTPPAFSGTDDLSTNCGSTHRVCGPQMDMGQTYDGDMYNTCTGVMLNSGSGVGSNTYGTALVANSTGCRTTIKTTPAFNKLRIRVRNDTAATYLNDSLCNRIVLTAAGITAATTKGIFAWQYETAVRVEWKNVKVKNLDVPTSSAIREMGMSREPSHFLHGGNAALSFSILESGAYSVKITELNGKTVKEIQGMGPVSNQNVSLGRAGIFIVKMTSPHQTSLKRVTAF